MRNWNDLLNYDQVKTASKIAQSILILQAERDYQVPLSQMEGWKRGLSKKKNVKYILYPGLNHLMMYGEGKPDPGEYFRESNIDEKVIMDIAEWVKRR